MTAGAWPHRPESRGHVRATSTDPWIDPVIQPNYLADPGDQRITLGGIRLIRSLLSTPELAPYVDRETLPGPDATTDDELLGFARENGTTCYHLIGTAKMGPGQRSRRRRLRPPPGSRHGGSAHRRRQHHAHHAQRQHLRHHPDDRRARLGLHQGPRRMRILLANPNTTAAITALMAEAARGIAAPGTEITAATAPFGAHVIGTRTEAAIAEHATLTLLAQHAPASHAPACDAAIIGASLDSALRAAREMLSIPVLGLTESALHAACLLGGRFGILTMSAKSAAITREMVESYGLTARLAGLAWLRTAPKDVLADPASAVPALIEAATTLIERDLADTIVLIGAVMAGMPARIQHAVPVPVLEGVTCAVPLAEALVRMALPKPRAGTYAALPPRHLTGIDPALLAQFGRTP